MNNLEWRKLKTKGKCYQKRAEMAQVNIHSMILKEKRGETGKQNMKIISEKG